MAHPDAQYVFRGPPCGHTAIWPGTAHGSRGFFEVPVSLRALQYSRHSELPRLWQVPRRFRKYLSLHARAEHRAGSRSRRRPRETEFQNGTAHPCATCVMKKITHYIRVLNCAAVLAAMTYCV